MRQRFPVANPCGIANFINVTAEEQESAMKEVVQECKMLHRLRHPNITQLYGLWRGYDNTLTLTLLTLTLTLTLSPNLEPNPIT